MSSGLRPFSKDVKKRKELLYNQHSNTKNLYSSPKPLTTSNVDSSKPLIENSNKTPQTSKALAPASLAKAKLTSDTIKTETAPKEERKFTEYMLFSSKVERTNNVLRFQSSHEINPKTFIQPIKLRRKERYTYNPYGNFDSSNKHNNGEMTDGKTSNTETFQIDETSANNEKNPHEAGPSSLSKADHSIIAPYGGGARNKQMMFKKKTKQIFFAEEQQRRLNIEESRPWILEDFDAKQSWTGTLEGGQKSNYVLFVLMRSKKSETHDRWLMKKRAKMLEDNTGENTGADTSSKSKIISILEATSDKEPDQKKNLVEYEDESYIEDDDENNNTSRKNRQNLNGGADEIDFEDHFEDDEEMAEDLMEGMEDEADKNNTQKKTNALGGSDDEHEEEDDQLGHVGKEMKDLMRKIEKNKAYDSDNEDNPYISDLSDQSDDEEDSKNTENENPSNNTEDSNGQNEQGSAGTKTNTVASTQNDHISAAQKAKNAELIQKKRKRQEIADEESLKRNSNTNNFPRSNQKGMGSASYNKEETVDNSKHSNSANSLITEEEIVNLIQNNQLTTKDLISKVKRKLKENPLNKQRISEIVKRIATQKNGILVLKSSK
ncbi:hypothetical protein BB561_001289 [Smittium simulii]|uniref:Transcription initiation factor IIF subunit alpha n=1 Tax=Smittium simulii TaxID=133385 RepID=A0A2T9YV93_9FUNG|nr:hypothetical protein BB561_001289 [Smittium simulii]